MTYYLMTCYPGVGDAVISDTPDMEDGMDNWIDGARLTGEVDEPLVFTIEEEDEGNLQPVFFGAIPLMKTEVVDALRECGVDNLETFKAIIQEVDSGREHHGYRAVNIVGLISAADPDASDGIDIGTVKDGLKTMFFRRLVVDDKKTHGMLMFRLAESLSKVIVHEKVRKHLIDRGFDRIGFEEVSG
jgi:hypothetical protein